MKLVLLALLICNIPGFGEAATIEIDGCNCECVFTRFLGQEKSRQDQDLNEKVAKWYHHFDTDKSGCLSLVEFTSMWNYFGLDCPHCIKRKFDITDTDGSGCLSVDELRKEKRKEQKKDCN